MKTTTYVFKDSELKYEDIIAAISGGECPCLSVDKRTSTFTTILLVYDDGEHPVESAWLEYDKRGPIVRVHGDVIVDSLASALEERFGTLYLFEVEG